MIPAQPLRFVAKPPARAGAAASDVAAAERLATSAAADADRGYVTTPSAADGLLAEQWQSRVRARIFELDADLATRTVWERFDATTGRADALVTLATPPGEFESIDVWLLCNPAQAWVLVVGNLDETSGAFRELRRARFDEPNDAAEAFWRAASRPTIG